MSETERAEIERIVDERVREVLASRNGDQGDAEFKRTIGFAFITALVIVALGFLFSWLAGMA